MDCVMASFVEDTGPGQILDRNSLVVIPSGYAKIIVCNNLNSLCVIVADLKSCLNDISFNMKISAKAFLTLGEEAQKGEIFATGFQSNHFISRGCPVLSFDKARLIDKHLADRCKRSNLEDNEVLQICIYTLKGPSKRKSLVGYIHIDLTNASSQNFYYIEGWYKIFPSSSHMWGFPVVATTDRRCCKNNQRNFAEPISTVPPEVLELFFSLPLQRRDSSASLFNIFEKADRCGTFHDDNGEPDPLDELEENLESGFCESTEKYPSASTSLSSSLALDSCIDNNNEPPREKSQLSDDQKITTPSKKSKLKRKFWTYGSFKRSSDKKQRPRVRVSEEVICDGGPEHGGPEHGGPEHGVPEHGGAEHGGAGHGVDGCPECSKHYNAFTHDDVFDGPLERSSSCDQSIAQISEGKMFRISSRDSDTDSSLCSERTRRASQISTMTRHVARKIKKSLQFQLSSRISSKQFRRASTFSVLPLNCGDVVNVEQEDNAYDVLKFIQSMPKTTKLEDSDSTAEEAVAILDCLEDLDKSFAEDLKAICDEEEAESIDSSQDLNRTSEDDVFPLTDEDSLKDFFWMPPHEDEDDIETHTKEINALNDLCKGSNVTQKDGVKSSNEKAKECTDSYKQINKAHNKNGNTEKPNDKKKRQNKSSNELKKTQENEDKLESNEETNSSNHLCQELSETCEKDLELKKDETNVSIETNKEANMEVNAKETSQKLEKVHKYNEQEQENTNPSFNSSKDQTKSSKANLKSNTKENNVELCNALLPEYKDKSALLQMPKNKNRFANKNPRSCFVRRNTFACMREMMINVIEEEEGSDEISEIEHY